MNAPLDLIGERFNRLVVQGLGEPGKNTYGKPIRRWICLCDCGTSTSVPTSRLTSGKTGSCGCLHRENFAASVRTHGKRRTTTYDSWASMKDRCLNTKNPRFHIWGGRGINICDQWVNSFETFLKDMGPKPPGTSLDRIDNNGNYEPSNCRWATPSEQANNLRTTKKFELNGKTHTFTSLAKELGCSRDAIKLRLRRGQTIEQIYKVFIGQSPS